MPSAIKALKLAIRDNDYNTKYGSYLKEFELNGGFTGFASLYDLQEFKIKADKMVDLVKNPKTMTKDAWDSSLKFIDDYNRVIENGARLATFIAMREKGESIERSVGISKDVSVNFNRRGEWSSSLGALYLFVNAGVQGTERLTRAFLRPDKKVRARAIQTAIALPMLSIFLGVMNRLVAGTDDDDEYYYDKQPDYIRHHNILLPNILSEKEGDFIQIPLPYGFNAMFAIPDHIVRALMGKETMTEALLKTAGLLLDSFSPVGGVDVSGETSGAENIARTATPTFAKPMIDFLTNKNFAGMPIYPMEYPGETPSPDSEKYFSNVNPILREMTRMANSITGGDKNTSGYLDVSPETIEHLVGSYGGGVYTFANNAITFGMNLASNPMTAAGFEDDKIKKVPFVRGYVAYSPDYVDQSIYFDNTSRVKNAVSIYKAYESQNNMKGAREYVKENYKLIALEDDVKAIDKESKLLRKEKKAIDTSTVFGKAREKRINEELNKIYLRFNKKYNRATGNQPINLDF
jgi:hypothetical protein